MPKDGNLANVILDLLKTRTDLDPNLFLIDDEQMSGSVHHRLKDDRTGHGGSVAVLFNYGTKIFMNITPLVSYNKGSSNVNLMFQSFMSLCVSLLSEAMAQKKVGASSWHMHIKSSCCVQPVADNTIEIPVAPDPSIFKTFHGNDYLYIPAEKIMPSLLLRRFFPVTMEYSVEPEESSLRMAWKIAEISFI